MAQTRLIFRVSMILLKVKFVKSLKFWFARKIVWNFDFQSKLISFKGLAVIVKFST
jgi:hypothetical protein